MKELHKILADSIAANEVTTVSIDSSVAEVIIRIVPSETMLFYGIGKQNEPGFTLRLSIQNQPNKGKRIIEALTKDNILTAFKPFAEKRSTTYVCDFKTDIDALVHKTYEMLARLKWFGTGAEPTLTVSKPMKWHTLKP